MSGFEAALADFDYKLPPNLIAQKPASPRDRAKLLVYDRATKTIHWSRFREIGKFLPKNAVLVLNETKVIPARLILTKSTEGKVAVLFLGKNNGSISVLANRRLRVGDQLRLSKKIVFRVLKEDGKGWHLKPNFPLSQLAKTLEKYGHMPLPPYIKSPLKESALRREYQTVFAKQSGSIAAPTASLHFTKKLLRSLQRSGIEIVTVTLHVHLGTFAPLTEEQWKLGKLHREEYSISTASAKKIMSAKKKGRPVIAVGTTVVRTLESSADRSGKILRPRGMTDLFIQEEYRFKLVDGLITNFHVPRSSLLMLVSAFTGREEILDLYEKAKEKNFRFFSFGDAMFIR